MVRIFFAGEGELVEKSAVFNPQSGVTGVESHGTGIIIDGKLIGTLGNIDEIAINLGEDDPRLAIVGTQLNGRFAFADSLLDESGNHVAIIFGEICFLGEGASQVEVSLCKRQMRQGRFGVPLDCLDARIIDVFTVVIGEGDLNPTKIVIGQMGAEGINNKSEGRQGDEYSHNETGARREREDKIPVIIQESKDNKQEEISGEGDGSKNKGDDEEDKSRNKGMMVPPNEFKTADDEGEKGEETGQTSCGKDS